MKKLGISIWRIFAYFIIYSFIGFLIETMYALVLYGVLESRQSFLYGPFCSIYGVGAVLMICSLQKVKKNPHTLFLGGFLVRWRNRIHTQLYWWKAVKHKMVGLFRQILEHKWKSIINILCNVGITCSILDKCS